MTVVAPLAGAWIEIAQRRQRHHIMSVAPLAGAWIEIVWRVCRLRNRKWSLPLRERGLKSSVLMSPMHGKYRRSPCGSVD